MKDRFKYIIFQYFESLYDFGTFLGQTDRSIKNILTPKGKIPMMAKFVIHVFDKLEEENRELKEEVRRLKKFPVQDVNITFPDFLYEDEGKIRMGYMADEDVTDEYNEWVDLIKSQCP